MSSSVPELSPAPSVVSGDVDPLAAVPRPGASSPGVEPLLIRAGERLAGPGEDLHTARAELTLALDDALPLRVPGFNPDPLTPFARAFAGLRADLGDTAEICLDLLPVTPGQRQARLRRAVRAEGAGGPGGVAGGLLHLAETAVGATLGLADQVLAELGAGPRGAGFFSGGGPGPRAVTAAGPLETAQVRARTRAVSGKLLSADPLWRMQLLLRTRSAIPGRAEAHLHVLIGCFRQWSGDNQLTVVGTNLGWLHLGADSRPRRGRFDRRMDVGRFRPRARSWVSTTEIAGLLKPPTRRCAAGNVERGFEIPGPPATLPTYSRDRADLVPLGLVRTDTGWRPVGVKVTETQFTLFSGRSGWGKTETSLGRFLALVRCAGVGGFLLDPHRDGLALAKEYLVDQGRRVLELDLSVRGSDARQAAWNPLSMEGFSVDDVDARAGAVVAAFASAMGWTETNTRALSIITMAAQSLCELALRLPPDLAPTIFQIPSILANEDWRETVIPYLSPAMRDYWSTRFRRVADHVTPVTNIIDRMRSSKTIAGVFGASRSTYNVRHAMDTGKIVLACPSGLDDKDRLIANMLVFDLFRAARSRADIADPAARRPCHAFIDELPAIDGGSRGTLARILEQTRKYGLFLHAATQQPEALTTTTLRAFLTNRSHLFSSAVMEESARLLARNWGGTVTPETIIGLERYTHLAGVTLDGTIHPPFLVRGLTVHQLFGDVHAPDRIGELDAAIDVNLRRRPIAETIADLDGKDDAILRALGSAGSAGVAGGPAGSPAGPGGQAVGGASSRRRAVAAAVPIDLSGPTASSPVPVGEPAHVGEETIRPLPGRRGL
ncbi:ATP/GTP-binding protein [Parafrankia sp. FMc2]|uniref:ATP/GTP-binding protein n=1 Tax=Parafrankia sp. FMc2 TaxID=3233196 RepID=UPI0034D43AF2